MDKIKTAEELQIAFYGEDDSRAYDSDITFLIKQFHSQFTPSTKITEYADTDKTVWIKGDTFKLEKDVYETLMGNISRLNDRYRDLKIKYDVLFPPSKPLKQLSEISDEDAIEVAKIYGLSGELKVVRPTIETAYHSVQIIEESPIWKTFCMPKNWDMTTQPMLIPAYQYLQSRNYELPKYF